MSDHTLVVMSSTWDPGDGSGGGPGDSETAFCTRSIAGALSRFGRVEIFVTSPTFGGGAGALTVPDGLFDLRVLRGEAESAGARRWPEPGQELLGDLGQPLLVLVEEGDDGALGVVRQALPGVPVVAVGSGAAPQHNGATPDGRLSVGPGSRGDGGGPFGIDLFVPVNALAAHQPHNGIGFVDYLLVLTDRGGRPEGGPTAPVSWLAGAFPAEHLVVVEGGSASVWKGRALRGTISVDTRTDLWRLMAHARTTVDLRPGELIARECVESLRFGTPVIVPAATAAARLAALGGGLWYRDVKELFGCVEAMADRAVRDALGEQGQTVADDRYGDAEQFVARVGAALAALGVAA